MNVTGKTKIYRKTWDDGNVSYSRRISSQKYENGQKGDWIGTFEPVQFPRGTDIPDKSIINITKAFEAVYETNKGEIQRKLIVQEYDSDNQDAVAQQAKSLGFEEINDSNIPF